MNSAKNQAHPEPRIIFENKDILVLNKPAGLVVHGDGKTSEYSLADWLVEHYPAMAEVGEPWHKEDGTTIARPGIVHRLDRETSGVMVVAKTQPVYEFLKTQFQEREAHKEYRAFVYGHLKEKEGVIDKPIGRSPADFRRYSAQPGARGTMRDAVTVWKLLQQGVDPDTGENVAYLSLFPKTGRTHQIRVHLKAIHHPVVSDSLYAAGKPQALGFTRVALHAYALTLVLPDGKQETFTAPLPPVFEVALGNI